MGSDFRFAVAFDAPAIVAFVNDAYHGPDSALGWTPETHLHAGPRANLAAISAQIAGNHSRIILCDDGGRLAGCVVIERKNADGHIGMLAVRPRLQAKGLGRAILAEAETRLVDLWSCVSATLTVINLLSDLIAYYQWRGYTLTGKTEPFTCDEEPGAVRRDYHVSVMRKPLGRHRPE